MAAMPEQAAAPSLTMTVYNPALLKKEDLIRGFVARQALLDRLLDDMRREGPATAPQHHLLIGQRGLGKTTLLRRLAYAMEDDPELAAAWMPLVFPEEQYNVASLGGFWLNCADALSDALDRQGERTASEALDARVRSVPADRAARSAAALEILIAEADRLQRRLLLLVDNLDILLERLDLDQEWEFRRVISEEHRLHFIGASSRVLEAFYEHGRAFYDFFQIHELKGLDDAETFTLLCKLAEQAGKPAVEKLLREQPGRIRTVRLLTGGNPRTLVLLFKVLAEGGDSDVQHDVEQLLDLYTPLYKARFEELPAQAQQLVDAMAIHWDPLTAADLTGLLRPLSVNLVSAQLKRLEDLGVVEKAPWFGEKKTAFQIAERFFNIWYLMRASRRVRQKLLWLVKFLEAWFNREELGARARGFLVRDPEAMGRERYAEMAFAYSQTVGDRRLRRNLESAGLRAVMDDAVSRPIDFSDLSPELRDKKERMQQLREMKAKVCGMRIDWGGIEPGDFWRLLGGSPHYSLAERARVVEQLPSLKKEELRELYERLRRAEQDLARATREPEAVAKLYEVLADGEMADVCDWEMAVAVAERCGLRRLPFVAIQSRMDPRTNREGLSAGELEKAESALRAMTSEPGFEVLAWTCLGHLLGGKTKRFAEAEGAYRRAIELDARCPNPWNALGWLFQGDLKRYEDAEQAFRKAIELDPEYATWWYNLGSLLQFNLQQYDAAEQAYRRAIDLGPHDADPWESLGDLLQYHLKRYEEAEQAYRRAIDLDPQDADPWCDLGKVMYRLERKQEAEAAYRRAIELDRGADHPWLMLGVVLADLERYDEAEQAYRRAIELKPEGADPWTGLGILLAGPLERRVEAEQAYRRAIELEPQSVYPWSNLGRLLEDDLGRSLETAEAYMRALQIDPKRSRDLDSLVRTCERLSESPKDLPTAINLLRQAHELVPDDRNAQSALAQLLTLAGRWPEAIPLLQQLTAGETFSTGLFQAIVKTGHVSEARAILERTGADQRCRPLYEALRAVEAGTPDYLRRVAPEVRTVAMAMLREIAPDLR